MPGLEDVRSVTSRGSAEINLFFNWNVDMLETLQLVDAAVSRVQSSLPPTAQIQTHRLDFSSFPIIGYSLTSDTVPQTDLWELATYDIKPRLNRLTGVASVLVQGGQRPEFHVTVDPSRMLRAQDVDRRHPERHQSHQRHRLAGTAEPQPSAVSRAGHGAGAQPRGHRQHRRQEREQRAGSRAGHRRRRARPSSRSTPSVSANGKPAVLLSVNRQPDSNTVQVADEVHQEMAAIRPTLPSGVEMRPFYDQSNIVNESIASVRDAIIIGLFLAGLIIWLFLRDWGTAVMTGSSCR